MKEKELRKIRELAETQAKKTDFYKQLTKRNYRQVKGYIDYKQVATDLASHLMCMETGFDLRGFSDTAWNAMTHSAWMAYENPIFPVFAITPELAEAFLKTDLSLHVCSVKKVFNSALFLLPNILQNPDGYSLEWVFTSHFLKGETVSTLPKDALLGFSNNIAQKIERIKSLPLEVSKFRWVIALVSLWGEYNQHKSLKAKRCV